MTKTQNTHVGYFVTLDPQKLYDDLKENPQEAVNLNLCTETSNTTPLEETQTVFESEEKPTLFRFEILLGKKSNMVHVTKNITLEMLKDDHWFNGLPFYSVDCWEEKTAGDWWCENMNSKTKDTLQKRKQCAGQLRTLANHVEDGKISISAMAIQNKEGLRSHILFCEERSVREVLNLTIHLLGYLNDTVLNEENT